MVSLKTASGKFGSVASVRAHDEQSFGRRVTPIGVKSRRRAAFEISSQKAVAWRYQLSRWNGQSTRKPRRTEGVSKTGGMAGSIARSTNHFPLSHPALPLVLLTPFDSPPPLESRGDTQQVR